MIDLGFTGRAAIVTGAASGMGAAFARGLAGQGADVALLDINEPALMAVAAECEALGVRALPLVCDVTDENRIKECVAVIVEAFGRIDVLINDAGICEWAPLEEHPTDMWHRVIDTNLSSIFYMAREVAPVFREQHYGRVVNMASVGSIEADPTSICYLASKGGVLQATRCLAAGLAPYGVLVNAIGPGIVETNMTAPLLDSEGYAVLKQRSCLKRFATPEELVPQMLLFASEKNTYCTGQVIYVDGGLTSQL